MKVDEQVDLGLIEVPSIINHPRIAMRVILRALIDLVSTPPKFQNSSSLTPDDVQSAKEFCLSTEHADRSFWCGVAGISQGTVIARAKLVLAGKISKRDLQRGYDASTTTLLTDQPIDGNSTDSDQKGGGSSEAADVD